MAEFLVIRLGADADENASWIVVDDQGTRRSQPVTGPLSAAGREIGKRAVIVLVPATSVLTTTVNIPVRGGARLLAALPFALEEHLADDVEKLHFAAAPRRSSGQIPVAVVAHEQMQSWLERLRSADIEPTRIVPENYGLARIPGTLSLLVADNQVIFNDGADVEFVMQEVGPGDALAIAGILDVDSEHQKSVSTNGSRARHLLVYCEPGEEVRFRHEWRALQHELESVDLQLLPDGALPRLAVTVGTGAGVNLLQGPYGPRTELSALFRPWRRAAMLLLTLSVLGFAGKAVDYYRLSREEVALREQFALEYRQIRPDDSREIMDPVGTVNSIRRSLGTAAAPQVFLPSLQQLALALSANATAEVEAISYRAGVVDIRLTAPDVATLDNIQKQVSASGRFSASIQSTDQIGDKINSRIQIRETGA